MGHKHEKFLQELKTKIFDENIDFAQNAFLKAIADLEEEMRCPVKLTIFHKSELRLYEQTIRLLEDPGYYIVKEAFDKWGERIADCYSLYHSNAKDYGEFWRILHELKNW